MSMEHAIRGFLDAVSLVPNRQPYVQVGRPTQLRMIKHIEQLAAAVLGTPDTHLRKITGGGWALRFA